ncbi:hypothetical protein KHQ06_06920 [Nocardia tengchongensis]|uniref:DUF2867 domain-containing protein n=1 Tax=Nocardia tengchongensis TaxID=2055889 RepID=A0ABX8CS22_9NOCA|nr:hypothetical protein [Nocardia tengchongensis]QVI22729.1 hypothetical protein KHQ06_06920 [Nocardia tengchongensis]
MERLPYIDEYSRIVTADRAQAWAALLRTTCKNPDDLTTLPRGFVLDEADPPNRLVTKGRHWFSRYRLSFRLDEVDPTHTRVTAITHAVFPGIHGRIYRALVIGTRLHRLVVWDLLRRIAVAAGSPA